jgi:ubiquinone/menaquinone biosynthesis C-methylase UbiE
MRPEYGQGTRVVDVTTGAGYAAAAAADRGAEVIGIDFSATQVALARQRYPSLEFREGDAGALPFPDGAFYAVVSNFGMPHEQAQRCRSTASARCGQPVLP